MTPLRTLSQNLFASPYPLLPLAVFVYFVLGFLIDPHSSFRMLRPLDTDDYMRLDEVIRWLKSGHPFGGAWYDLSQPRVAPGEPVVVNWARLVDLPIAFFMLPFLNAFGFMKAALISSMIVPPLLFGLLLYLVPYLARPLVGADRAALATLLVLFLPAITFNYSPSRVDHHGYQILIAGFGLLCLERILFDAKGWIFAILAGVAFALGLWIGVEALPWIILFAVNLALLGAWKGGSALQNAGLFGLAFALATLIVLPIAVPPDHYTDRAVTWFSMTYVIFAFLTGAVFLFGFLFGRHTRASLLRILLLTTLALFAALLFFFEVPAFFEGPYADFDAVMTPLILDNVNEAQPLITTLNLHFYDPLSFLRALPLFLHSMFLPLVALIVTTWNMGDRKQTRVSIKFLWIAHFIFLLPAILLTFFWQVRVIYFAELYALPPLTWFLWHLLEKIGAHFKGRPRFWMEILAFAFLFLVPVVLIPAAIAHTALYPDVVFFPVTPANGPCNLTTAGEFLSAQDGYGDRPRLILSGLNEGAELLFRTPHNVLSAPYNVRHNQDVFDFFDAREDTVAHTLVKNDKADLVLVCRTISTFYAGLGNRTARLHASFSVDKTGHLQMISNKDHPTLIEKLAQGQAPNWLKPVEIPGDKDYLLYEVK
jgi:hypothetical protein